MRRVDFSRENTGLEVDATVQAAEVRCAAFEVKPGSAHVDAAAANLEAFADRVDSARSGKPSLLGIVIGLGYGLRGLRR